MTSIIILVRDRPEHTQRCLLSLPKTDGEPFEVVVVDNGSGPPTVAMLHETARTLREGGIACTIARNETNVGCSTARNRAMEAATGRYICFMDNDTEIRDPGWLATLRAALEDEKRCGMVGPKLVYPSPEDGIQCAGAGVTKQGRVVFYGRGAPVDDPRFNERRDVQFLISACLLFRRSLVAEIGGLDEAYNPVQFEDTDFCYRARSRGYRAVYVPGATVVHHESATTFDGAGSTNAYLVIKHGMTFKKRWRHMFEQEDGPSEAEAAWRPLGRWNDGGG